MVTGRLLAVLCGLALLLPAGTAGAAEPGGRISALEVMANRVQFLFTAHGLPPKAALDPDSVTVTAAGRPPDAPCRRRPNRPARPAPAAPPPAGGTRGR